MNAVIIGGADGPTAIFLAGNDKEVMETGIPDYDAYEYEGEGIGGTFVIWFYEDGSYAYCEGAASSYIGVGTWTADPETMTVTLVEDEEMCGSARVNRFAYADEEHLQWIANGSDNFVYITLTDGAAFQLLQEIP